MASSYSSRLRLEMIATGEQSATWGVTNNTNLGTLIEEAIAGSVSINMPADADYTLSTSNGASDEARQAQLYFLSAVPLTATRDIIIPGVEKTYWITNRTTGGQSLTIRTASPLQSVVIPNGYACKVLCTGTSYVYQVSPAFGWFNKTVEASAFTVGGVSIGTPPGVVADFAGASAPAGWLLCYGQAVSRTTYAALFAAIGTAHGAGDGSTTFNLPDARDRARIGKGNMGGTAAGRITSAVSGINTATLGATGGDQNPQAHTHASTATATVSINDPGHVHGLSGSLIGAGGSGVGGTGTGQSLATNTASATTGITATAAVTMNNASSGTGASGNIQPGIVFNVIIKT